MHHVDIASVKSHISRGNAEQVLELSHVTLWDENLASYMILAILTSFLNNH